MRRLAAVLICLLILPLCAWATEDTQEVSFSDLPPRPYVSLVSPLAGQSYESGGRLTVQAEGPLFCVRFFLFS